MYCLFGSNTHLLLGGRDLVSVSIHKLQVIKLGGLDNLHLADVDITKRVDAVGHLLDILPNRLQLELLHAGLQIRLGNSGAHDIEHLLAKTEHLGRLRIAVLLHLVVAPLGETNDEHAQSVAIRCLQIKGSLNQSAPLADQRAKLVGGQSHTLELGQAAATLNILDLQLDVAVSLLLVLVQITQVDLEHASLQLVSAVLVTNGLVHQSLADRTLGERARGNDVVPLLAGHEVNDLALLLPLLTGLRQTFVFANSHGAEPLRLNEKK
mmetsp:Transcript_35936/g.64288  ORF Transcript_35936/g.64288 Transcript_35936/m.64288 type:complete len:266 (-) Transcript_35936:56-853(-)